MQEFSPPLLDLTFMNAEQHFPHISQITHSLVWQRIIKHSSSRLNPKFSSHFFKIVKSHSYGNLRYSICTCSFFFFSSSFPTQNYSGSVILVCFSFLNNTWVTSPFWSLNHYQFWLNHLWTHHLPYNLQIIVFLSLSAEQSGWLSTC